LGLNRDGVKQQKAPKFSTRGLAAPVFVGIDVERVEEIYDQLLELELIRVVRQRREVSLTPQGRKVAGKAMSEQ
jgi:helix-turn-helix protein